MTASTDEITPASPSELARFLTDNARAEKRPVMPVGGRTALRTGLPVQGNPKRISTSSLSQVIDYPARDLTITVQSGIRVSELQRILAEEGQRLPMDIPDAGRATLGGALATNTSGPGRYGHGTFRDFVIGISGVDGTGRLFSAGGRVVKNVAGYDICKLMIGSLGTLAVVTEVTLKLRPTVEERRILWLSFDSALAAEVALQGLTTTATRPVAVELLNPLAVSALRGDAAIVDPPAGHALCIAFEGTRTQCEWQMAALIAEVARVNPRELRELSDTSSESLWKGLVEFQAAGDDPATFSASLPPSKVAAFVDEATNSEIATQAHAGNGIVVGHLPDRCVSPSSVNEIVRPLRARAEAEGGSLVLWNCEDAWKAECSVFGASRPNARWMQQVKLAMDPHNLMSPGRLSV